MKKGQGFARRVTVETLKKFSSLLRYKTEDDEETAKQEKTRKKEGVTDSDLVTAETLFSGNPIRVSISPGTVVKSRGAKKRPAYAALSVDEDNTISLDKPSEQTAKRGLLIWQKENLPKSDVQRQKGNVTGGLRLTQAKFG